MAHQIVVSNGKEWDGSIPAQKTTKCQGCESLRAENTSLRDQLARQAELVEALDAHCELGDDYAQTLSLQGWFDGQSSVAYALSLDGIETARARLVEVEEDQKSCTNK